eukprot:2391856-Rhodomonas_salina.1
MVVSVSAYARAKRCPVLTWRMAVSVSAYAHLVYGAMHLPEYHAVRRAAKQRKYWRRFKFRVPHYAISLRHLPTLSPYDISLRAISLRAISLHYLPMCYLPTLSPYAISLSASPLRYLPTRRRYPPTRSPPCAILFTDSKNAVPESDKVTLCAGTNVTAADGVTLCGAR